MVCFGSPQACGLTISPCPSQRKQRNSGRPDPCFTDPGMAPQPSQAMVMPFHMPETPASDY